MKKINYDFILKGLTNYPSTNKILLTRYSRIWKKLEIFVFYLKMGKFLKEVVKNIYLRNLISQIYGIIEVYFSNKIKEGMNDDIKVEDSDNYYMGYWWRNR